MASSRLYRVRRFMRHVPREPRCKICNAPFRGLGAVLKIAGFAPTRKNPNFCNSCFERAPLGGEEMEVGILFADVRGFTSLAETLTPAEVEERLRAFYEMATDVLMRHDAVIDKVVGDEVMALFLPAFVGDDYLEEMVSSGEELLQARAGSGARHPRSRRRARRTGVAKLGKRPPGATPIVRPSGSGLPKRVAAISGRSGRCGSPRPRGRGCQRQWR